MVLLNTDVEFKVIRKIYRTLLNNQHKLYGYTLPDIHRYINDSLVIYTINNNL